jgi:3-oxoacyl-[acyl-carrier protein] reductase
VAGDSFARLFGGSFSGRVVLVTGASKGIGAATARLFGALGATVAVAYLSDAGGAAAVVRAIEASGGRARAFAADLARWETAEGLVRDVERALGPLDVAALCHGIWKDAPIDLMSQGEYTEMMNVNLRGVFSVCGAAVRSMRARGAKGSLVLVASTAGQRGEAEHAHYAATKGALISLTKSLAAELAPDGIRVNCVAPGWVATPMTAPMLADAEAAARVLATIPLGRVGTPEEIAAPIAFVASELASFMTGEIVNVNGGAVLCG